MKYLLDTSVFLCALAAVEKLNPKAQQLLSNTREGLFFSAASAWEIDIKYALGRLQLPQPPAECVPIWLREWGIRPLEITHLHALSVADLPSYHHDPFDRMLIAQARMERMTLMTADRIFGKYAVETFWCGR
jgi:PIN domain nuclease of toxin-antitoxin system